MVPFLIFKYTVKNNFFDITENLPVIHYIKCYVTLQSLKKRFAKKVAKKEILLNNRKIIR